MVCQMFVAIFLAIVLKIFLVDKKRQIKMEDSSPHFYFQDFCENGILLFFWYLMDFVWESFYNTKLTM